MPRRHHSESSEFFFNVTARCINQDWFALPIGQVWEIMTDHLYFLHHGYGIQIRQFVLMSNHYHLVLLAPLLNLSRGMNYMQRETSRWLTRESGRINQCWGGRYRRTMIRSGHYLEHAYKYNYRNPVRAGLSTRVETYRYSTLGGLLGFHPLHFPVLPDENLSPSRLTDTLTWLNTRPSPQAEADVRLALRRRLFSLPKVEKRINPLEFDAL